jgi:manganese efflux pump family protein
MSLVELFVVALSLALDAFAVAVAAGLALPEVGTRRTVRLAFHFGLFQALMTLAGAGLGFTVAPLIERWDHWIAFGLLAAVGGHMGWSGLSAGKKDAPTVDPSKGRWLVIFSVATSIDALAVGIGLALIGVSIWRASLIIGVVAAALTVVGLHLGRSVGKRANLQRWAELSGGVVLLAIGVKILFEHGVFG